MLFTFIVGSGNKQYRVCRGTFYQLDTAMEVLIALENARINNIRITVCYGDPDTGADWLELYDVTGRVSRSVGPVKVPVLMYNSRSDSGPAILDNRIIKIVRSKGGEVLYKHPSYHIRGEAGA